MNSKDLGAIYTPTIAADYMVGLFTTWKDTDLIWDPAGGDGALINACAKAHPEIPPQQIHVWDINPEVKENFPVEYQIRIGDTLLPWEKIDFAPTKIIANPPYLNKQSQYMKKNRQLLQKAAHKIGLTDTYAMFILRALEALPENGELVFLVSDTYRSLKIYHKLRQQLLQWQINSITSCPLSLFKASKVTVSTSIIHLTKNKPAPEHKIINYDFRNQKDFQNPIIRQVLQQDILDFYPNQVFYFGEEDEGENLIKLFKPGSFPRCQKLLNGGLGMYARQNSGYVYKISDGERLKYPVRKKYYKEGGDTDYWQAAGHEIRWEEKDFSHYVIPPYLPDLAPREGFLVSGVCSRLTARFYPGDGVWNSNKAMAFFPKDPQKYPVYFWIGLLNSQFYRKLGRILNHTNSIQVRDVQILPLLPFTNAEISLIASLAQRVVAKKQETNTNDNSLINEIENIVNLCYNRTKS